MESAIAVDVDSASLHDVWLLVYTYMLNTKSGTSRYELSILVTENGFRGARWLVVVIFATKVIPCGTG